MNKRPIFKNIVVLYYTFNKKGVGLEIHLKEDGTVHAQAITDATNKGEVYESLHVVFNDVDLGRFRYLAQLKR